MHIYAEKPTIESPHPVEISPIYKGERPLPLSEYFWTKSDPTQ